MIRPDTMPTGLRILIAEDEPVTATATAAMLRMDGHEVFVAEDGASALEAVEAYDPDVLLLDIGLPDMTGYEVARRLRQNPGAAEMLLVAVTGYGSWGDRQRSEEAGFYSHMVKPVEFAAVEELLTALPTRTT